MNGMLWRDSITPAGLSLYIYNYLVLNSSHNACVLGSDVKIHVRTDDKVRTKNILEWWTE